MQSAAASHLYPQHLESSLCHLLPGFSVFTGLLPPAASALLQPLPSRQSEWSLLNRSQTMAHLTGKASAAPFALSGWCCLPCPSPPSPPHLAEGHLCHGLLTPSATTMLCLPFLALEPSMLLPPLSCVSCSFCLGYLLLSVVSFRHNLRLSC